MPCRDCVAVLQAHKKRLHDLKKKIRELEQDLDNAEFEVRFLHYALQEVCELPGLINQYQSVGRLCFVVGVSLQAGNVITASGLEGLATGRQSFDIPAELYLVNCAKNRDTPASGAVASCWVAAAYRASKASRPATK